MVGILVSAVVLQALGAGICMFLLGGVPASAIIIWSILSVFGVTINLVFTPYGMIFFLGLRRGHHIRAQNCCTSYRTFPLTLPQDRARPRGLRLVANPSYLR